MKNGAAIKCLILIFAVVLLWSHAATAATPLPEGVMKVDTDPPEGKNHSLDEGYPTTAATIHGNYLWMGRDGGLRRYDRETLETQFFKYDNSVCKGHGTINVAPDGKYVWGRLTNTGALCRLDPSDGSWSTLDHWTVKTHTGPGFPFIPDKEKYFVASTGSPDWEGVSLIGKETGEWIKLLKTKPVSAMHLDSKYIWLGVPEGILRIDRISEEYHYIQPYEHGGGAMVKDIVPIPGGYAFATIGDRTGILGDKIKITKNTIQVYMEKHDAWYTYDKSERGKIVEDIQAGRIVVTNLDTTPGLLIFKNGEWKLLTTADGLPADAINDLEKDSRFLYASSHRGICALDLNTLQPAVLNTRIASSMRQVRKTLSDDKYLWIFSNRDLYRVEKKHLFSSHR